MADNENINRNFLEKSKEDFFLVGLLSIIWYVFRTGGKPSRASYPCQQVASFNSRLWVGMYILPILSRVKLHQLKLLYSKKVLIGTLFICVVAGTGYYWYNYQKRAVTVDSATLDNGLTLSARKATESPSSDIFVVTHTTGNDGGVNTLLNLMNSKGLKLYQSDSKGEKIGPSGLISVEDVVIIKVNCQWDERGGTNTDLLKALINALLDHPDGFIGEIIVCDNGQGENRGSLGRGGSFSYTNNNAVDTSQSIQDVVDSYINSGKVSTYLWSDITETRAFEFCDGDFEDGYIVEEGIVPSTGLMVSYPKFKTDYGTCISFKKGVWNFENKEYNSSRLKVINLSMLKSHTIYGTTSCIKNYMGVPSDVLTSRLTGEYLHTHNSIGRGGMGTLMVKTRFPVLNIIDSIWVNPIPSNGPITPYNIATQMNIITASTDPVALDYWSSKNILLQNWQNRGGESSPSFNPDHVEPGSYGDWLRLSMSEIVNEGYTVNIDESNTNVYITENS
jgi:hypothetical protein